MADVIITVYEKKKAIHTDLLYNRFCKISKKEFTEIEMKKKRTKLLVFFALAGILVLFYMIGESYCEGLSRGSSLEEKNEVMCKYKYDMIVDSPNSSFWQAVYDCAQEWAQKNDAILELRGSGRESDYSKLDYMNMSIASNSDGIILQYSGEQGLEAKINEAVQKGIPVVTVMGDAVHSKRQSFVGVSDYQLGSVYGEKVAEYVTEDTESILILLKKNIDDMNQSQIYTQISNAAQAKAGSLQNIQITGKNLRLTGTFETEEAVTDIFQQRDKVPDILVCMDEETTECARQAVLDFNLAGKVTIIGYYSSEDILTAVEKGVISVTCDVDTEQLGRYSIEALTAYQKDGRKYGMTCAWAMQVDYDKLVCLIGSQSDTGRQIKEGQEIGVSVLTKHQKAIAEHFGEEHSSSFDKFEGVTYTAKGSSLLIPNSARAMVCQVIEVLHLKGIEEDQLVYVSVKESQENSSEFLHYGEM